MFNLANALVTGARRGEGEVDVERGSLYGTGETPGFITKGLSQHDGGDDGGGEGGAGSGFNRRFCRGGGVVAPCSTERRRRFEAALNTGGPKRVAAVRARRLKMEGTRSRTFAR